MDTIYTGNKIAQRRKALGLTQKDIAQSLHLSVAAVSKWERGLNFPDLLLIPKLSELLGITAAELLGLEDAPTEKVINDITEISRTENRKGARVTLAAISVSLTLILLSAYLFIKLFQSDDGIMRDLFNSIYGVLPLTTLGFGVTSWTLAIVNIFKNKRTITHLSYGFGMLSLYLPTVITDMIMRYENYGTVEDTVFVYNLASAVLILGVLLLNLCRHIVNSKKVD